MLPPTPNYIAALVIQAALDEAEQKLGPNPLDAKLLERDLGVAVNPKQMETTHRAFLRKIRVLRKQISATVDMHRTRSAARTKKSEAPASPQESTVETAPPQDDDQGIA